MVPEDTNNSGNAKPGDSNVPTQPGESNVPTGELKGDSNVPTES